MFANHVKIAFRSLINNKQTTFINLLGLSIGITSFIFMLLYIMNELSYDRYNENINRLYRIVTHYKDNDNEYKSTRTPSPLAGTLVKDFPFIEKATRLKIFNNVIVSTEKNSLRETQVLGADSNIFQLFTFPFIKGNSQTALVEPRTMVITRSAAAKYFGPTDPVNKQLKLNFGDGDDFFTITGIIENVPRNSHFHSQLFVSNATFSASKNGPWNNGFGITYFLLTKGVPIADLENRIGEFANKYIPKNIIETFNSKYIIQKVKDIHLYSHCRKEMEGNGNILTVYIFSTLALLMLLVTCINFMNLSTAKSEIRAKEVGLFKIFGAPKWWHTNLFFLEAAILCFISLLAGLLLSVLLINLFQKNLYDIDGGNFLHNPYVLIGLVVFTFLLSIITGLYPTLYFSSSKLISLFKNRHHENHSQITTRNILSITQIVICMVVLIFNIIVYKQQKFIQNIANTSFDTENIIIINNIDQVKESFYALKKDMANSSDIADATLCNRLPCKDEMGMTSCSLKGKPEMHLQTKFIACDNDYLKTLNIKKLKEGRFFSGLLTDQNSVIINEKLISEMNLKDPIGKQLVVNGKELIVIGIINDFNYEPIYTEIQPLCMVLPNKSMPPKYLALKVNSSNPQKTLAFLRSKWESYSKEVPFEYSFYQDDFQLSYKSFTQVKKLASIFLLLIILTSSIGLIGLIIFISEKRTKEIGIRKVNGARISEVMLMLNKDFIKWVAIAFVIACPIAWYAMHKWLENFAYKTELSWWIFLVAGTVAVAVAVITISWQSWRAATRNPVESLRYE